MRCVLDGLLLDGRLAAEEPALRAYDGDESFGHAAAALEFALEGLYLMRRLSKDAIDGGAIYRT